MVVRKKRILVVSSDAGSARFFECARIGGPLIEIEAKAMHAEAPRVRSKPPRVHDRLGPGRHVIEARQTPRDAAEIGFLKSVAGRINEDAECFDEVVLCAPPRPLGVLREHLSKAVRERMSAELAKDFVRQSGAELSRALERAML